MNIGGSLASIFTQGLLKNLSPAHLDIDSPFHLHRMVWTSYHHTAFIGTDHVFTYTA